MKKLFLLILFTFGCGINPENTYTVYSVTDSNGKTYHNLIDWGNGHFRDVNGNEYVFHGDYTQEGRNVLGKDLLLKKEVEKQ